MLLLHMAEPLKVFKYFMIRRGLSACAIVPWIMLLLHMPLKVFKYFMMIKYLILFVLVACFVVNVFYL